MLPGSGHAVTPSDRIGQQITIQIARSEEHRMTGQRGRRGWGWVRRLPSRRFQASYIGPDLARHYGPGTYAKSMDAETWLGEERRLIDQGIWTPPKQRAAQRKAHKVTLAEYAETWIEHRKIKPSTRTEHN